MVLRQGGYLLIPIIVLIYMLMQGYTPLKAAYYCIVTTVVISLVAENWKTWHGARYSNENVMSALAQTNFLSLKGVLQAMENGGRLALGVAAACACTGFVIGVVTLTGLGLKLANAILTISADSFALTLLLKPEGNGKLSKRDGDRLGFPVFPLEWHDPKTGEVSSGYREAGYLPEAVINFLALLGWNPGNDQELMSMDELVKLFDLSHCSKAGAKFDYKKGIWFNHEYILQKPDAEIAELFKPVLAANGVDVAQYSDEFLTRVVSLVKGRVNFVKELWDQARFFFVAPETYAEKDVKKRWSEDTPRIMGELVEVLRGIADFSSKPSEDIVIGWITEKGYHMGNVMNAFRLAVVGECKGPHMFDITELLGKEETIRRIQRAVEVLK